MIILIRRSSHLHDGKMMGEGVQAVPKYIYPITGARLAAVAAAKKEQSNLFLVAASALVLSFCPRPATAAPGTDLSPHAAITTEALAEILGAKNLHVVIEANDNEEKSGSEGSTEPRRHCDGSHLPGSVSYIDREKKRALTLASEADSNVQSRADALRHFGMMLHAVQDFYTRSNYVELQLENPQYKHDPFNIPLVDWSRVPDGYKGSTSGNGLTAAAYDRPDDILRKDSKDSIGGRTLLSDNKTTYYAVAKDLATRETQRQWNLFEALLRAQLGSRSAAVIASLRQAGVDGAQTSGIIDPSLSDTQ